MAGSQRFQFANVLRGRLAERILTILLERGSYRVTKLGIEELFDEVKTLNRKQYRALGLPEQLRSLPDLLVADPGLTWAKMIEVKYRRKFDRKTANELFATLSMQRKFWPQSYAVVIVGHAAEPDLHFHQDYIRVIPPDKTELLKRPSDIDVPTDDLCDELWDRLPMLHDIFQLKAFESLDEHGKTLRKEFRESADFITRAIRDLGKRDRIEN